MLVAYRCSFRAGPEEASSVLFELPAAALTSEPGDGDDTGGLLEEDGHEPLSLSASERQLRGLVSMLLRLKRGS